jgi:hypothetical protein
MKIKILKIRKNFFCEVFLGGRERSRDKFSITCNIQDESEIKNPVISVQVAS